MLPWFRRSSQPLLRRPFSSYGRNYSHSRWRKTKAALFLGGAVSTVGCCYYLTCDEQERRQIRVTGGGIVRFFRTSYIGAVISLDYYWSLRSILETEPEYVAVQSKVHKRAAERILDGCLKNGGLYIKLGQGLVIMDHILPKEYIETLKVLQDKCLERSSNEVHQLFKEEFNSDVVSMFKNFEQKPFAAASLAQVFRATTKEGLDVAVKVQYIDLQDRFVGDVLTLNIILKMASWLHPAFDFAWVLKELRGTLERELNFLIEAKNAERCAVDLKHLSFVHVPDVLWDYSTTRVLTTEFINGIKISDKAALKAAGISLADLDNKLFTTFSEQIFYTGFVHADPHPGNILVRKDEKKQTQLVILDHGLYEEVPLNVRESLRNLWKAMVLNDHVNMKKHSMELGIKEEDYRLFCIAIGQRYIKAADGDVQDSNLIRKLFAPQKSKSKMTPEEKARLQMELGALRSRSLDIFKAMPSKLMLVTRNINTIRSIARGHGDPVNRYNVMARCAAKGTFQTKKSKGVRSAVRRLVERADFEVKLWWGGVRIWWWKTLVTIVILLKGGKHIEADQ